MNTQILCRQLAILSLMWACADPAFADLLSRRGGTMVYDTDTNLTWLADANLFAKQSRQDPDLVGKIVQSVGYVHTHWGDLNLSYNDFIDPERPDAREGKMTMAGARAWANYLNYGGFDDWHLPEDPGLCTGYYCMMYSEMGSLLYRGLLAKPGVSIADKHGPNYALFDDIQIGAYWLGNDDRNSARPSSYTMYTNWNLQDTRLYTDGFGNRNWYNYGYAWAVRYGDVGELPSVPLPGAAWLFLTGLLAALHRRRR